MSMELDHLDSLAAKTYDGFLVRKDLVRKYARQYPVPTYVVEFLLGRYCASVNDAEIAEGLAIVEQQLKDRTVRTGDEELFKARAKEDGSVRIIDLVKAKLDAKNDCYVAELPSLALRDVRIASKLVTDNERMLTDGFFAEVTLGYDGVIAQEQGGRPFSIESIRPIQMSKSDILEVYGKGRAAFTTQEWIDFLIRSNDLFNIHFTSIAKGYFQTVSLCDHVIVGKDVSIGTYNDPRTKTSGNLLILHIIFLGLHLPWTPLRLRSSELFELFPKESSKLFWNPRRQSLI